MTAGWAVAQEAAPFDSARSVPAALSASPDTAQFAPAPLAPPVAPAAPSAPIVAIHVTGNTSVDSARVVRSFEVPIGTRYTDDAARRGIRKLYALGLFTDVWVEKQTLGEGVELTIHVTERPRVGRITFDGNVRHSAEDLNKKLFMHVGEVYSPSNVQSQVDSLLRFYRQEGYSLAQITAASDSLSPGLVAVKFAVKEGEKVKITDIEIVGGGGVAVKRLRKELETKAKGLIGGGEYKAGNEEKDREKLETYYHNHGYRDAKVTAYEILPGAKPKALTLRITVDEGPLYRFGQTVLAGYTLLNPVEVASVDRPVPGDRYDQSKIAKAAQDVASMYAEKGYLYLNVEPEETVRDRNTVDVTLHVAEGKPSHVRFVHVSGNHNTREKVVRRELSIHEGDLFRRSALVRSQGDVFRLGIFDDVQVDFAPAESTDVDVNLKVKEKQVGTASAGAGYTSESGLTGFLQLGHTNVLGNNQSAQITLERGPKRTNYLFSFTEPWFHDTPTLLGFELFNNRIDRDIYVESRRGGSIRTGRPLPWPDFSRGYITYRLEDVMTTVPPGLTASSALVLTDSSSLGHSLRTSSLEFAFQRNSTNNPFYPTRGSRLNVTTLFAGGVLGGAVDYNKTRIEGRKYFRSGLRGVTTMVRARLGVLAGYGGGHEFFPSYETFRLGGANVTDPLRGYDDYQVVPEENIKLDSTLIRGYTRDANGSVIDSTSIYAVSKVRYPGGRWMGTFTLEEQFPIVNPLHGILFFDAGNTWNNFRDIKPELKLGAGIGFRLDIPLLGTVGLDWGYGFNRDDGARFKVHFLLGPGAF